MPTASNQLAIAPPPNLMDYFDAQRAIKSGAKVTKEEWSDPTICCALIDGKLHIKTMPDKLWHPWIISDGDMVGEDWYVVA